MKLSKSDLCDKCRKIRPRSSGAYGDDETIEDLLDSMRQGSKEYSKVLTFLEFNGGCPMCIGLLRVVTNNR